jgi:UDP-3-O-[3-hydroxymyristoyl] glucosamine N-acyltransferase
MNLFDLTEYLPEDAEIINDHLSTIVTFNAIVSTVPGNISGLTFVDHKRKDQQELVENSLSKIIICGPEVSLNEQLRDKILIKVKNPKLVFSIIGNALFSKKIKWGVHPSAIIDPEAVVHQNSYIGPNCYIGNVTIDENTVLEGNVFLYDGVEIGKNVIIYAGSVIGSVGFGHNRDESGFPIQFPHVGKVIIEDFAEIGSNTTIDIGSLSNTIIGWGSKLDNLVHIGHNVIIGKCVYISACTSIAGSTRIGDYSNIWTGVRIADGLRIGERSYIGMGSVVISDIPDGKKCFGNPARVIGDNL